MAQSDMAKRFGTIFLAGFFLISTLGLTAILIWENSRKEDDADSSLQAPNNQTTNPEGEGMLEGTTLEGFTPSTTAVTELQIIDLVEGTGDVVSPGATVTAHYTGALVSDGTIFQSSLDTGSPFTSPLGGLIKGWQEGIPGMKVGGKRRLVIPYEMAYGEAGSPPSIPAKADLVFDIEMVSVQQ